MNFDRTEFAYLPTTGVRRRHETPLVRASDQSLRGYGCLVDEPTQFPIEIVRWPEETGRPSSAPRERALIWRANYHPDGGQLVHPRARYPFVVPLDDHAEFLDRQGRVHARVSVDFPKEFGCYLASPLREPGSLGH